MVHSCFTVQNQTSALLFHENFISAVRE